MTRKTPLQKHTKKLYASMVRRLSEKKDKNGRIMRKGVPIEYTEQQLHDWLFDRFFYENGSPKFVRCPYSNRAITFSDCSIDHKLPLSRGGAATLENLCPIHPDANQEKGKLTAAEYILLLQLLEQYFITPARNDIRGRLKKAVKLAASVNWARKKVSGAS